ncbi:MAG: Gmad2 immunoglobulin-like domain-containing protein [Candidatus Liptonbacteria bacterium]|nr:Gmad2 immunoglobulin-like domain-containing protein [Candidatus Liptonbacteria bacterium]
MKILVIVFAAIIAVLLGILIFVPAPKTSQVPVNIPPSGPTGQPVTSSDGKVMVFMPHPNDKISSPVTVQGTVTGGGWYFEASFPVTILDGDGTVLGRAPAQAQSDWMTTGTVPFAATITFGKPKYATGTILLEKDNPSGLPQNAGEFRVPVSFGSVPVAVSQCKATGCSGEVCSDQDVITNCVFLPQYSCYRTARCERQPSGECGWTQTPELSRCLQ